MEIDKEKLKWDIDNAIDYIAAEIGMDKLYLQRTVSNESYNRAKYIEILNQHPKGTKVIDGSNIIVSRVYQKLYEFNPIYRNKLLYIMFDEDFNLDIITDDDDNQSLQELRPNQNIDVTIGHFLLFRRYQLEHWQENHELFELEYTKMVEMCKAGKPLLNALNEAIEKETGKKPYPVNTIPAKSFN